MLIRLTFIGVLCLLSSSGRHPVTAQDTPFEFIQRHDVGREIGIQPAQLTRVRQLQPICDAQCQARLMETFISVRVDLQTEFLALDVDERQQVIGTVEQDLRESVEMEMLEDEVLAGDQMTRLQQLRTQFGGLDSFLTDRVSGLTGMSPIQINQLQEIQNIGSELVGACQQNPNLSPEQKQVTIQNIQNVLIDQSINILNDAQLEIFVSLCGEQCNFDPTENPGGSVGDSNTDFANDADSDLDSAETANGNGNAGNSEPNDSATPARPVATQSQGARIRRPTSANKPAKTSSPENADSQGSQRR